MGSVEYAGKGRVIEYLVGVAKVGQGIGWGSV